MFYTHYTLPLRIASGKVTYNPMEEKLLNDYNEIHTYKYIYIYI